MKLRALIAISIPILALLAWTLTLETRVRSGKEIEVRVEGYDPRDLLAGHYIRFRLALGTSTPCTSGTGGPACVCFEPSSEGSVYAPIISGSCEELLSRCSAALRGQCFGSRFEAGIERYYIPERLAPVLQTIPEASTAVIALDEAGKATIKALLVAGEPVEEFAERLLREAGTKEGSLSLPPP
jgi:uncharacterized membrane-anchored protein